MNFSILLPGVVVGLILLFAALSLISITEQHWPWWMKIMANAVLGFAVIGVFNLAEKEIGLQIGLTPVIAATTLVFGLPAAAVHLILALFP